MATKRRIGFIGLGTMGKPMAANLIKAGFSVVVLDLDPKPVAELVGLGAVAGSSPRQVAAQTEVVITMLPSSPHVERVVLGPDGVLEGLRPGGIVVDMSTIDPLTTKKVAQAVAEKGGRMLDAPVSGAPTRAREGTLTIMVGGDPSLLEECREFLAAMGSNIIHVGGIGMGEMVKLANQVVVGASMIAVAEAFALGVRAGVAPKVLFEVMSKSSANCWALQTRVPYPGIVPDSPANQEFAPGFTVDLMQKDLGLALSVGKELKVPLLMSSLVYQLYGATSAMGNGRKDFSAVSALIERLAAEGDKQSTHHGPGT